jgi:O-antigen ligase
VSGRKRTSVGRDAGRKFCKFTGKRRPLNGVARRFRETGAIAALAALSVAGGAVIVFVAQRLDFTLLLLLVAAVPAGLYALRALPLAGPKIYRLLGQLRRWHLLWFMLFLSGLTVRIRGVEDIEENPLDPAAIYRVVLVGAVGLVLLGTFSLRRRPGIHNLFRGLVGWLTTYGVVSVLSTFWSVYPAWTLYRSMEYLTAVALIAAIVGSVQATRGFKVLFDWTWLLTGLVLVSVWLGVVYAPEEAVSRGIGLLGVQLEGVFPRVAANGVGDLGAVIGIVSGVRFLYGKRFSRKFYLPVLALAMVTLALSQSRSPLAGFLLATALILFMDGRISLLALGAVSIALVASLTPLGDTLWEFFLRGQSEELFLSLSGRVNWWEAALPLIKEDPLLGFGAYAAGRFLVAKEFSATLSSLHGTWPEVLIGMGVAGLLPLLAAVVGAWMILLRPVPERTTSEGILQQQLRLEAAGVLALLTVRSMFSVEFIWHPALSWLLILGYAEFLRRGQAKPFRPHPLPARPR